MDETDRKILEILREDGRAPYTTIADELDVSEGTVRNRVERMLEDGTIERFTVEVGEEHEIEAFVMVSVDTDTEIEDLLESMPRDLDIYELAGDRDLLIRLSRETSGEVNDAVDSIRMLNGVESTRTYMVLGKPR